HHPQVVPGSDLDAAPSQESAPVAGRDPQLDQPPESDEGDEEGVEDAGVKSEEDQGRPLTTAAAPAPSRTPDPWRAARPSSQAMAGGAPGSLRGRGAPRSRRGSRLRAGSAR